MKLQKKLIPLALIASLAPLAAFADHDRGEHERRYDHDDYGRYDRDGYRRYDRDGDGRYARGGYWGDRDGDRREAHERWEHERWEHGRLPVWPTYGNVTPGHYEVRSVQRWVPAHSQQVWLDGYYQNRWVPGHYETVSENVWVP